MAITIKEMREIAKKASQKKYEQEKTNSDTNDPDVFKWINTTGNKGASHKNQWDNFPVRHNDYNEEIEKTREEIEKERELAREEAAERRNAEKAIPSDLISED